MKVMACSNNDIPVCPPDLRIWVDLSTVVDFGAVGINAESIFRVISFGFGVVIAAWAIGYATGVVIRMVNKA